MHKNARSILIVLSVLALLNVIFVPIFDVWGGLFPTDVDKNFLGVIESVFEGTDDWSLWVVQLTMSIFIPSILMLIMSLIGSRGLFMTSNLIGIFLWFKKIIDYGMEDDGFEDLFDFEDGCISIGTWIAIAIFIISFFVAINSKKKKEEQVSVITGNDYDLTSHNNTCTLQEIVNENISVIPADKNSASINFCPNCGTQIENKISFCGKCGYKL